MTGLNGKRKAVETPLAKRPAQHKPQASRRTKRTKEPALPRKRESSTARAPLADGRDEYASVSYSLRNRIVYVPIPKNTSKHIVPSTSEPAPPESDFRQVTSDPLPLIYPSPYYLIFALLYSSLLRIPLRCSGLGVFDYVCPVNCGCYPHPTPRVKLQCKPC
jgi:hypothetical protein